MHGTVVGLLVVRKVESGTIAGVIAIGRDIQHLIRMKGQSCGSSQIAPFQLQQILLLISILSREVELLLSLLNSIIAIIEVGVTRQFVGKAIVEFQVNVHKRIAEYLFAPLFLLRIVDDGKGRDGNHFRPRTAHANREGQIVLYDGACHENIASQQAKRCFTVILLKVALAEFDIRYARQASTILSRKASLIEFGMVGGSHVEC